MKVLITGGAGFIGSHLAETLLRQQCEIFVIDDLSTGSFDNIKHLEGNGKFHYSINTILDELVLRELVDKCDIIFHLAASVGVQLVKQRPIRTIETNVYGAASVLKHAISRMRKTIIVSSSEVYGRSSKALFSEDDELVLGSTNTSRWIYACSKAMGEYLAKAYWREKGLPIIIVRLFNTIGPRQIGRYGMVVPRFVEWALSNKPLLIYGNGKQTRCFTYVSDVVGALISLINKPEAIGQVFNIGNSSEITIADLASKIIAITNSKSELKYIPYELAFGKDFEDVQRRSPDLSKIRRLIDYKPKVSLDDMLAKTIEWARKSRVSYLCR